jgi:hypothetical protein
MYIMWSELLDVNADVWIETDHGSHTGCAEQIAIRCRKNAVRNTATDM